MVLKPAEFVVETAEGGQGEIIVYVEDPEGHTEEVCRLLKWSLMMMTMIMMMLFLDSFACV